MVHVRDNVSAEDRPDLLLEITLTCRCWQETGRRQLAETVTGQRPVQQRLTVLALPLVPHLLYRPARPGDVLLDNLVKLLRVAENGIAEHGDAWGTGELGLELQHLGDEHGPRAEAEPPFPRVAGRGGYQVTPRDPGVEHPLVIHPQQRTDRHAGR